MCLCYFMTANIYICTAQYLLYYTHTYTYTPYTIHHILLYTPYIILYTLYIILYTLYATYREEVGGVRQARDPIEYIKKLLLDHSLASADELKSVEKDIRASVQVCEYVYISICNSIVVVCIDCAYIMYIKAYYHLDVLYYHIYTYHPS